MPPASRQELSSRSLVLLLALIFAVALGARLLAALDYGRDWYGPGSFTHINFDEAGSCRAALGGFNYSSFVGHQTLWLTQLAGSDFPAEQLGNADAVKTFCHGETHLTMARLYSALTGALTVLVLFALVQRLFPRRPELALGSAALLAVSGWHISESLMGTVDAASTFFIYLFFTVTVSAASLPAARRSPLMLAMVMLALVAALATKYWVFALLSVAVFVPVGIYPQIFRGVGRRRLVALLLAYGVMFGVVSNPAMPTPGQWLLPLLFYALPPWSRLSLTGRALFLFAPWLAPLALHFDVFAAFTAGSLTGVFGTDYGAIGWHKPLRNVINLPAVMLMGLGIPAFFAGVFGIVVVARQPSFPRLWLVLLPLPAFALYMAFMAPVTYYRHYLPLLPAACVFAAVGMGAISERYRRLAWGVALAWQSALALDLASDYHLDPRRTLADWYAEQQPSVVMHSYYVKPPPGSGAVHRLFKTSYARDRAARLRLADTLILSENWYDTAFANELNGPVVHEVRHLIKTTPDSVVFHRAAVADEHPLLTQVAILRPPTFMPELLVHRALYGSFTQFVGDIRIFRVAR